MDQAVLLPQVIVLLQFGTLGAEGSGRRGSVGEGTLLAAFGLKRMRGEEALLLCGCWSWAPALLVSASVPGPGRGRWLVRIPLSGSGIPGGENAEPRRLVWTSGGGRQVQGLSGRSCPDAAGALGSEPERWETARRWTCLCVREQEADAAGTANAGGWYAWSLMFVTRPTTECRARRPAF